MLQTKVTSEKRTSLGIERQSDLCEVLCIVENNKNTFPEINNNFLEVPWPILRYHHARNQGLCQKNRLVSVLNNNSTSRRYHTSSETMRIHSQK